MAGGGRVKNLFGNMALFTLGNFVSKLLVMLLVPLYTNVLTTREYGIADGLQTTLLLLVPLLTMNIGEAALRFGIEREGKSRSILGIMLKYTAVADIIVVALCGAGYFVSRLAGYVYPVAMVINAQSGISPMEYFLYFQLLFVTNSLYEGMILYCQGCERIRIMVAGSICCTALILTSNILFLLVIKTGLEGYLLSQVIAYLGAGVMMLLMMRRGGFFTEAPGEAGGKRRAFYEIAPGDRGLEREMVSYGRSMMVYSTSSWINNAIDRYFVIAICGAAANGLYAVAYKIPAILTVFQRIFAQAWQISANKTYDDEDAPEFFAGIYEGYQSVMTVGCSFLILIVRFVAALLFAKEFYYAWPLVPPLLISVIFGALTGFLGSVCLAFKDGGSMGLATGVGAVVNIILNSIMIKYMGPMGAAMATMISYGLMYILALRAARGHVSFRVNTVRDMSAYLLLMLQMLFTSADLNGAVIVAPACFLIILVMYMKRLVVVVRERFGKK